MPATVAPTSIFTAPDADNPIAAFLGQAAAAQPLPDAVNGRHDPSVLVVQALVLAATTWRIYSGTITEAAAVQKILIDQVDLYINAAWSYRTVPGATTSTSEARQIADRCDVAATRVARILTTFETTFSGQL